MATQVNDSGIVNIAPKEFPALAVNVLERLGYRVTRVSKQLAQILANERLEEQVGRDWWHHEYRLVVRWDNTADQKAVLVSIEISEHKGGGSKFDCQDRCHNIFLTLESDAERARQYQATREPNTTYGAARWGSEQELKKAGYFQKQPDAKRLIIGKTDSGDYLQVPELLTYAHALICGRTGVGKSRGFFIPQLIERIGTNMIVTEATPGYEAGELYKLTSGWRKLAGHEIYSFNPSDMSSHRINPIDRIRHAPEELKGKLAENLAELVIMNGESAEAKNEQTWNRSEKILLTPLLLHAAASEPKYGHLGSLRWLLLQGPDRLAKVMYRSPSDVAQMEFDGWMQLAGQTDFRYGVFSGLLTKLNPWMTDQIVALTETTDIDMDALKEQLFTFYLAVPSRSKDSKLIGSLMLNFLLSHVLEIREEMKYPVAMLLDEFTNFGKIDGIGATLSIIRKNQIGLMLGLQNYFQLEQVYSRREAQIIIDMPATQVYFKQKSFPEAKLLSDALGRMTIEETTVTDGGRVHELVQGRALASPEELINLKDEVIIFTPDTWPLKLPITSPTAYQPALEYPPPEREKHSISEFIRTRGRAARPQKDLDTADEPHPPKPRRDKQRNAERNMRQRAMPKRDSPDKDRPHPSRSEQSVTPSFPDQTDTWLM